MQVQHLVDLVHMLRILPLFLVHFLCLASSDMSVSKNGAGLVKIRVSVLIFSLAVKNITFSFLSPVATQQSLISTCLTRLSASSALYHACCLWQRGSLAKEV